MHVINILNINLVIYNIYTNLPWPPAVHLLDQSQWWVPESRRSVEPARNPYRRLRNLRPPPPFRRASRRWRVWYRRRATRGNRKGCQTYSGIKQDGETNWDIRLLMYSRMKNLLPERKTYTPRERLTPKWKTYFRVKNLFLSKKLTPEKKTYSRVDSRVKNLLQSEKLTPE